MAKTCDEFNNRFMNYSVRTFPRGKWLLAEP